MQRYGLTDDTQYPESFTILLKNIGEIHAERLMKLDESYVEVGIEYRAIIILMAEFFADMQRNGRKDTKYSHAKLKRLLAATEILQAKTP